MTHVINVEMAILVFPAAKSVNVVSMGQNMQIVMKMENVLAVKTILETNVANVLRDITMSITIVTHVIVILMAQKVYNVQNLENVLVKNM